LRQNPFFGINIKKLKGDLGSFYRYRIGNHRLFYTIDKNKSMVFIVTLKDRKDSY
jgi:mRNA interferase RelE/StbE